MEAAGSLLSEWMRAGSEQEGLLYKSVQFNMNVRIWIQFIFCDF